MPVITVHLGRINIEDTNPFTGDIIESDFDSRVEIIFKDTGHGIKREDRDKIFDPFFTTREVGEGTGLGLSACYGMVTNYGGHITFESVTEDEDGDRIGTTFTVSLPAVHL